jgi:hypothetical protein
MCWRYAVPHWFIHTLARADRGGGLPVFPLQSRSFTAGKARVPGTGICRASRVKMAYDMPPKVFLKIIKKTVK